MSTLLRLVFLTLALNAVSGQGPECTPACRTGQVCAPVRRRAAVCVAPPIGGALVSTDLSKYPLPLAFFPLTGGSVETWPRPLYNGTVRGAVWRHDHEFGAVLHCSAVGRDVVELEAVPFGDDGALTVSFWFKKDVVSTFVGQNFQYLLSVSSHGGAVLDPGMANQLHFLLPDRGNPTHGTLVAVFRDANDDGAPFHLDSDGRRNSTARRESDRRGVDFEDGEWHMVTLTTQPNGRGYRLYVDGERVAQVKGANAPGGDAVRMTGKIHLCGRSDGDLDRHFEGSIAKLTLFNAALEPRQIEAMFVAVRRSTIARQLLPDPKLTTKSENSSVTLFDDPKNGMRYVRGAETDRALSVGRGDDVDVTFQSNPFSFADFVRNAEPCPTMPGLAGLDTEDFCSDGICMPVRGDLLRILRNTTSDNETYFLDGLCTSLPAGGALWRGQDPGLPLPLAYFPMTGGELSTWPIPNAQGRAVAAEIVADLDFGRVFQCDQTKRSFLILDNVAYGQSGHFALNLWFKPSNLTGDNFQYLLSHQGILPLGEIWQPNQVQIVLGETQSKAPGIVRAVVKDTTDAETAKAQQVFLDSDGDVALVDSKDPDRTAQYQRADVSDGAWHMVTLTTREDFAKGFSMYLDGVLAGEIREDVVYTGDDGTLRDVAGGDALRPGGKIYLCGRSDGADDRHFSGRVAELMFFDSPLTQSNVESLFQFGRAAERSGRKLRQADAETRRLTPEDATIPGFDPGSWWGRFVGAPGEEFGSCSGDVVPRGVDRSELVFCGIDLSCLPVMSLDQNGDLEESGICVRFPTAGAYVFSPEGGIELPMGYFPLKDGSVNSFPFPTFEGSGEDLIFVEDDVFGSVLDCAAATKDVLALPSVPYTDQTNDFTMAIWIRRQEHHEEKNGGYETIFSHIQDPEQYSGLLDPNQIQILLRGARGNRPSSLRIIVRDDDDQGSEFEAVDVDPADVDVTDGAWHMIAVTSQPNARRGFLVFADGVEVGGVKGGAATGGGVMKLRSDIHLCGAADGSRHHHFDGNVAHLLLWDAILSQQELLSLYERGLLSAEGDTIEHPTRRTVAGDPCVFPAILRGEVVTDCTRLDGALRCPIKNGEWKRCADFEAEEEEVEIEALPAEVRFTVEGERCMNPGQLNGREVFGCVDFDGTLRCETRPSQWKECSPRIELRYSVSGAPCVFPFTYQGTEYSDCVGTEVTAEICQIANGEFEECAPAVFREEVAPSAPDRPVVVVESVPSRLTVDGQLCQFPWMFEGLSVGSCLDIGDSEKCRTVNGTMAACREAVYTMDLQPCVFPFSHQGRLETTCVQRSGQSMCRVADGSWQVCGRDRVQTPPTDDLPLLPGRVTVDNRSCAFPFWFEGVSVSDCVGEGAGRCQTAEGEMEDCRPRRLTVEGDQCSFPFGQGDDLHYTCLEVNGEDQCRTADGYIRTCAPVALTDQQTVPRLTVRNASCAFPFDYDGRAQRDCVVIGGEEVCKLSDGTWSTCAPLITMKIFPRTTEDGEDCSIPFVMGDQLLTDCVNRRGREMCRVGAADGPLRRCADRPRNLEAVDHTMAYPLERNTTEGAVCSFPFQYLDAWWVNCLSIDGAEECKIGNDEWQECLPLAPSEPANAQGAVRFTMEGERCVFPVPYNGEEHFDCVVVDGTASCKDADGDWDECAPLSGQGSVPLQRVTRFTVDGERCVFPLPYNGEEHFDCVVVDGTASCKDADGDWHECLPAGAARVAVLSEDGSPGEDGEDSSLSGGAVAGIVIAVMAGVAVVVAAALFLWQQQQKHVAKNFERTDRSFEKFENEPGNEGIAMSAMGRSHQKVLAPDETEEVPL